MLTMLVNTKNSFHFHILQLIQLDPVPACYVQYSYSDLVITTNNSTLPIISSHMHPMLIFSFSLNLTYNHHPTLFLVLTFVSARCIDAINISFFAAV